MARRYLCTFVSSYGDVATTTGQGNTRTSAERSARRNLPNSPEAPRGVTVGWSLREIKPINASRAKGSK